MKVWIDADRCRFGRETCRVCLEHIPQNTGVDWPCIMAIRDDTSPSLTIYRLSGQYEEMFIIPAVDDAPAHESPPGE